MNLIIIFINIDINKKKDEIFFKKSSLTEMKDLLTDQLFSEFSAAISAEVFSTSDSLAVKITLTKPASMILHYFSQQECHFCASENATPLARVQVEHDGRWLLDARYPMQERMQFQAGGIGAPDKSGKVVDQDVLDVWTAGTARDRISLDPLGRKTRRVLLVEELSPDSIREALQRYGPVLEMREQKIGYPDVVIQDLAFGEPTAWIEDLVQV